jgi:phospholipase D1/2
VVLAYTLGGLIMFPVTLLMVATALTFGPITAFIYSILGCLSSAVLLYGIGHVMGKEAVRKFAGSRLNSLNQRLSNQGLITIITLRIIPVAPYTIVNFIAGASHIRFRDFVLGTIIGMSPGIFAITMLGDRLGYTIRNPGLKSFLFLAGMVVFLILLNVLTRRWLERRHSMKEPELADEDVPNE